MFPLVFLIVCLVIFLFVIVPMMTRYAVAYWRDGRDYPSTRALDILNERFARGDINKEEYGAEQKGSRSAQQVS